MTPKEKARELVKKFYDELPQWVNCEEAKQCALICVDEIINSRPQRPNKYSSTIEYYQEVEQELLKM
jgi:hypothetical protein